MGLLDIFSKRNGSAKTGDPYAYDDIPETFRAQVVHLWLSSIGRFNESGYLDTHPANGTWASIHDGLCREYGVFSLSKRGNPLEKCVEHLMTTDVARALDIIELTFAAIDSEVRSRWYQYAQAGATQEPTSAIEELNARFREHRVGYQFVAGHIVRVDSAFLHAEVVAPAMALLRDERFAGAEAEFQNAHQHFRHGRYEECMTEALKAFESTLKTICDRRGWRYDPGATAAALIAVVFERDLIPKFLDAHLGGVRAALQAGVPTLRNRLGGHGQGEAVRQVPKYLAAHILHLTGANILLLLEAHLAR